MKKLIVPAVLILFAIAFEACSSDNADDEARKKEKEKIEEYISGTKVQFYKAIKIAIRSTSIAEESPELAWARNTMLKIGGEALSLGAGTNDSAKMLNPLELLSLAGDLYKAKDVLIKTDEDSLPTILGNIFYVMSGMKSSAVPQIAGFNYENNMEHALIGLLWMASVKGPKEFTFYELNKAEENKIPYYDLVMLVKLSKALAYYENNFPYNGMDRSAEYISLCEKSKEQIIATPPFSFTEGKTGGEQTYYQLHGMGHLLKGLNEKKIEKEKESLQDFDSFLGDAQKGGLDNELTWIIGSYVYIEKEDKVKALENLSKLEKSTLLDQPEKDAIAEIKSYLEKREDDAALTKLNDKIAIGKITFNILKKRAENAKQLQLLKENAEGKKFLALHNQLTGKAVLLEKMSNNFSTDSLAGKAENLIKGLFDSKK